MSDKEPKAKLIPVPSERKKAVVVPTRRPVIKIGEVQPSLPALTNARDFVAAYRANMGLAKDYGFTIPDFERMAREVKVAPIRLVFELRHRAPEGDIGHWMLFIRRSSPQSVVVYDPVIGVNTLDIQDGIHKFHDVMFNDPEVEAQWGPATYERRGKVKITTRELLNPRNEQEFEVNEQRLQILGPLQQLSTNPADCGPFAVYAAVVARQSSS
ncbi:MAG: hypothetical protein HYV40_02605 [Candidatus Levybacteria bacterium]|nr:hypothetical protein [Candidatus Levybacteria bacterium]